MARGPYYGGYFGGCEKFIPNPFHPYWKNNEEWKQFCREEEERRRERKAQVEETKDSVYKQYLHRVLVAFREAKYKAVSDAEYWTLDERVHYYWHKWNNAQ